MGQSRSQLTPTGRRCGAKIDSFVTAYNAAMEFMNNQSRFTPAEGDDGGGETGGLLFGDSAAQ